MNKQNEEKAINTETANKEMKKMGIEEILKQVDQCGDARIDFCNATRRFASEIIKRTDEIGGGYRIRIVHGNGWTEHVLESDVERNIEHYGEIQETVVYNYADAEGDLRYIRDQFQHPITCANYDECVEFIRYMSDEYGKNADQALKNLEDAMKFFAKSK